MCLTFDHLPTFELPDDYPFLVILVPFLPSHLHNFTLEYTVEFVSNQTGRLNFLCVYFLTKRSALLSEYNGLLTNLLVFCDSYRKKISGTAFEPNHGFPNLALTPHLEA